MWVRHGAQHQAIALLATDSMAVEVHGHQQGAKDHGPAKPNGFLPQILQRGDGGGPWSMITSRHGSRTQRLPPLHGYDRLEGETTHCRSRDGLDAGLNGEQTCAPLELDGLDHAWDPQYAMESDGSPRSP